MKTLRELLIEARRMEALSAAFADNYQGTITATNLRAPRVVMTFSRNHPHVESPLDSDEGETFSLIHRWLEITMVEGAPEYRLLQAGNEHDGGSFEPEFVLGGDSAFVVLAEGYEVEESERLAEALAPIMQRVEADGVAACGKSAVIEEIEQIVGAGERPRRSDARQGGYSRVSRGRLGPSEFISAAVARHCHRQRSLFWGAAVNVFASQNHNGERAKVGMTKGLSMNRFLDTLAYTQPYSIVLLFMLMPILWMSGCATAGADSAGRTGNFATTATTTAAGAYVGAKEGDGKAKNAAVGAAAGFIVGETINYLSNKAQREAYLAGYEKGQSNAVKQQYWIARDIQRTATDDGFEETLYEFSIPQTERDGVRREPTTRVLRVVLPKEES